MDKKAIWRYLPITIVIGVPLIIIILISFFMYQESEFKIGPEVFSEIQDYSENMEIVYYSNLDVGSITAKVYFRYRTANLGNTKLHFSIEHPNGTISNHEKTINLGSVKNREGRSTYSSRSITFDSFPAQKGNYVFKIESKDDGMGITNLGLKLHYK